MTSPTNHTTDKKRTLATPDATKSKNKCSRLNTENGAQKGANLQNIQPDSDAEALIAKVLTEELMGEDPITNADALSKLTQLCSIEENQDDAGKYKDIINRLGGHAMIIASMKKHIGSIVVHNMGFSAILNISRKNKPFRDSLCSLGAIEVILTAMSTYSQEVDIEVTSCGALCNLAYDCNKNADKVVVSGGIEMIIAVMKRFSDNVHVQRNGSLTIYNVCAQQKHRRRVIDADGMLVIGSIFKSHPSNHALHEWALKTINRMVSKSDD
jgi:hypothetical protein